LIYPGQRLVIPSLHQGLLPAPIVSVEFSPPSVGQGHTLRVRVRSRESVTLSGTLDGRPLTFAGADGVYWAVAGFAPWSVPGPHVWTILANAADGRSVEVQGQVSVVASDFPIQYINLPPDRGGLLDPTLVEAEWQRVKAIFEQIFPSPLWEGSFNLPVKGELTSLFGTQRSYNGGPISSYHLGTDYAAGEGEPVWAANSGRVVLAESLRVRGNTIIIDHGLGVYSAYFHLSRIDVQAGQMVAKGDPIGAVGSTGLATGPHLHWEMRIAGVGVDPTEWTERSIPD
ncbi:MAG: M23 family metallopeptidase, partial [Chloroflexi bacterium]|nr:M23 family metallopeptidase [Chloroflexota bacterium]